MRNPVSVLPPDEDHEPVRFIDGFEDAVLHLDRDCRVITWSAAAERTFGAAPAGLAAGGRSLLFTPAQVAAGRPARALQTALLRGHFQISGWRARADGHRFWAEILIRPLLDERQRAAGFLAFVHDTTDRKRRVDGLRAALEISQAVLQGIPPEKVLRLLARRARSLLQADGAQVVVHAPGRDELHLSVAEGWNARQSTRCSPSSPGTGRLGATLTVPLARARRRIGTLVVYNRVGGAPFRQRDLGDLRLLASHAGLVVQYAGARRGRERLVAEEQARLWRILRKGTIQSLDKVAQGLASATSRCRDLALRDQLAGCVATVDGVIQDVRNHVLGFPPRILDGRSLDSALLVLARDLELRTGLATVVQLEADAAKRLGVQAGEIVQLVREAFSNVGRHAQARRCRLSLEVRGDRAWMQIQDDGVGFAPDQLHGQGHGLSTLRERVVRLGGQLQIDSAPQAGTTLRIGFPL